MIRKVWFVLLVASLIASCSTRQPSGTAQANMPNPASVYCEQNGGKLEMRQDTPGGVAGICTFPDGSECDEWAYFRKGCKPGDSLVNPTESKATLTPVEENQAQIVFTSNRDGGYSHVYVLEIGSSNLIQLTQGEDNAFSGPFSPDGAQLLFTGFGLTHSYIGLMNPDGSAQTDLTKTSDSDEGFPAWSPDGKQIAFTSRRDGNWEIYLMDADGSGSTNLTDNPADDQLPYWKR